MVRPNCLFKTSSQYHPPNKNDDLLASTHSRHLVLPPRLHLTVSRHQTELHVNPQQQTELQDPGAGRRTELYLSVSSAEQERGHAKTLKEAQSNGFNKHQNAYTYIDTASPKAG